MRLKRVRICGFKTFPDQTEFDVHGDIIAVIGPNGCGKSNIVDAILWGLGEASAKQLRAQTSQDVIFSGSAKRRPVGFAEVTLHFDNEDGSLPLPTSEVVVSRRLTRGGDSDYQINRRSCRQRDVYELLADSGLGRAGYAIVGQKEIDQALAASADDRRSWVDEAAGVQRYRARKLEARRRISSAEEHLARVHDILSEIRDQVEPLRQEAEVAARYKSVLEALRSVEQGMLVRDVQAASRELGELNRRVEAAIALSRRESEQADRLDGEVSALLESMQALDREIEATREQESGALQRSERHGTTVQLLRQRLESLDEIEVGLSEQAQELNHRLAEATTELEHAQAALNTEKAEASAVLSECSGAGEEALRLRQQLADVESRLKEARKLHAEALRLEVEMSQRAERRREAARELDGLVRNLPDLVRAVDEAREVWESARSLAEDGRTRVEALSVEHEEKALAVRELQKRLASVLSQRAQLEGKQRGIEATLDAHEGVAQGARAVLEAVERGELPNRYVLVGESIQADRSVAIAIETALGAASNDLIVEAEADAKRAIEYLKDRRLGRVTLQPIPLMRPVIVSRELSQLLQEPGVVGRASELVSFAPEHRPVIESLLGRTVVVESLDVLLRFAKTQGWSRLVTLDGEVAHSSGAVSGGHHSRPTFGLVQRRAELGEVEKNIAGCIAEAAQLEKQSEELTASSAVLEEQIALWRSKLKESESEVSDAREWHRSLADELAATERSKKRLEEELERLRGVERSVQEEIDLASIEAERDAVLRELAARTADAEQAERRIRESEARVGQSEARLAQAVRRLEVVKQTDAARKRRAEHLDPERDRYRGEIAAEERLAEAARQEADRWRAELEKLRAKRQEKMDLQIRYADEARQARQGAVAAADAAHQAELSRARADSKRANAAQRLVEEYGIGEEEALELPEPECPPDASVVTSRLRRELKAMGDVNLGAIEAYERMSARRDELEYQKADIEEGMAQVLAGVKELDKLTREKFLTTFGELQGTFERLFQRVFPGGEAQLSLTQPDDPLETGIEIDVTLPGKRRQKLELLSGGERSLCATAFLFSLLEVKPTPLVILDEVDAPLDGRNVERFVDMVRDFSKTTQFLLVTHNPTTIEAASVWLGVTMQEPGISTLVPFSAPSVAASAASAV